MKIEILDSRVHGRGVFAKENINKNEIIEECPLLIFPREDANFIDKTSLYDYYFFWTCEKNAIALGFGSIYNHSYRPNALYIQDFDKERLIFKAIKNIRKSEEIRVNYNGKPWDNSKVWFEK